MTLYLEHFLKDLIKFPENVGSTAILMLKIDKEIYIVRNGLNNYSTRYVFKIILIVFIIVNQANLGDSRAVICKKGKTYFETKDCDWTKSSGI